VYFHASTRRVGKPVRAVGFTQLRIAEVARVRFIDRFGEARIIEVLNALGNGATFEVAGEEILAPWGGSFEDLVHEWQKIFP